MIKLHEAIGYLQSMATASEHHFQELLNRHKVTRKDVTLAVMKGRYEGIPPAIIGEFFRLNSYADSLNRLTYSLEDKKSWTFEEHLVKLALDAVDWFKANPDEVKNVETSIAQFNLAMRINPNDVATNEFLNTCNSEEATQNLYKYLLLVQRMRKDDNKNKAETTETGSSSENLGEGKEDGSGTANVNSTLLSSVDQFGSQFAVEDEPPGPQRA